MNLEILKARINRNGLMRLAGDNYRDHESSLLQQFIKNGQTVYVGIESERGEHTVVGESIYICSSEKKIFSISIKDFLLALGNNAMNKGKAGNFEYVHLDGYGDVWLKNGETMNALWNTIMMVDAASQSK